MTPRRSAFADSQEPAADIPPARKPSRSRAWDNAHRKTGRLVSVNYRFIPVELRERIKAIAKEHNVPAEDIARLFLEWGARAYDRGEISFETYLVENRYGITWAEKDEKT